MQKYFLLLSTNHGSFTPALLSVWGPSKESITRQIVNIPCYVSVWQILQPRQKEEAHYEICSLLTYFMLKVMNRHFCNYSYIYLPKALFMYLILIYFKTQGKFCSDANSETTAKFTFILLSQLDHKLSMKSPKLVRKKRSALTLSC